MTNILDDIPAGEPIALVAGDAWRWKRCDLTDFASGTFTIAYKLRPVGAGGAIVTVDMTASGSDWLASKASAATATVAAGNYVWSLLATRVSDGERVTIDQGTIKVLPNLATDTSDRRSHVEKTLDVLELLIEGRAGKDVESYTIGDRQLSKMPIAELLKWRTQYRAELRTLLARQNGSSGRRRSLVSFRGN